VVWLLASIDDVGWPVLASWGENIRIDRSYNSAIQESGLFGFGWKTAYDASLTNFNNQFLTLKTGTGRWIYFGNIGNNTYNSASAGWYGQFIKNTDSTYTVTFKDGRRMNLCDQDRIFSGLASEIRIAS